MSRFQPGDQVRKIAGYAFAGTVVSVHPHDTKCCVRNRDGWDQLFSDNQLGPDVQEYQYLDLLKDCLDNGVYREGRNGGTYGLFGRQLRFDLSKGFPLLTTKRLFTKAIVAELLWFIAGDTNVRYLHDHGISIWDEWADEHGDLGPVYGHQWRWWTNPNDIEFQSLDEDNEIMVKGSIDQLANVIEGLKTDPYGRRHIVTAWNPADIPDMALPPCHCLFQFFVADGKLSCQLYQRSADVFLGVPFNIASYALLTHLVAAEVGLEVGDFVHTFGDVHLYGNHIVQAQVQLSRTPVATPVSLMRSSKSMFDLVPSDIEFLNYDPLPAIKAEVSA